MSNLRKLQLMRGAFIVEKAIVDIFVIWAMVEIFMSDKPIGLELLGAAGVMVIGTIINLWAIKILTSIFGNRMIELGMSAFNDMFKDDE